MGNKECDLRYCINTFKCQQEHSSLKGILSLSHLAAPLVEWLIGGLWLLVLSSGFPAEELKFTFYGRSHASSRRSDTLLLPDPVPSLSSSLPVPCKTAKSCKETRVALEYQKIIIIQLSDYVCLFHFFLYLDHFFSQSWMYPSYFSITSKIRLSFTQHLKQQLESVFQSKYSEYMQSPSQWWITVSINLTEHSCTY